MSQVFGSRKTQRKPFEVIVPSDGSKSELFNGVSIEDAAAFLKEMRSAKFTQAQFVKRIGMNHVQYLSQLENAKLDWRKSEAYRALIIRELDMSREELFERAGIGSLELLSGGIDLDEDSKGKVHALEVYQARIENGVSPSTGATAYIPLYGETTNLIAYQIDGTTKFSLGVKNDGLIGRDIVVVDKRILPEEKSLLAAWDEDRQTMLIYYADEQGHIVLYSIDDSKPPVVFQSKDLKPIGVIVWRGGSTQR